MASGDVLAVLKPQGAFTPASNPASKGRRNTHPILVFDGATNQTAYWNAILLDFYTGNGLTISIHYSMATETANDVDWDIGFERIGDQVLDIDGNSFAAVNSVDNTTVPGTTGLVDVVTIAFTDGVDMASVAAGEQFRLELIRDAASDTSTGDAEVHLVVIRET